MMNPQEFVAKWRLVELKERSAYQSHFNDLCALVGHPSPTDYDPTGQTFTFEAGAGKQTGGQGFADVFFRGRFAWEYKGHHADLEKAYRQLLLYRESLENPPLLVVSDFHTLLIHTNFTNTPKQEIRLTLDDLLTPAGLQTLRYIFTDPDKLRPGQTTEQVTEEAARQFAHLAELLRLYGAGSEAAAHFLIRLLFCLFAEDAGLLPENIFTKMVAGARTRPAAFNQQLAQLFAAMSTGGWFGPHEIMHFDGRLFDDAQILPLDSQSLEILHGIGRLDWSQIEPSILGTLFERSLDPAKRAQLGAHYTSREDILLIVEPVLMQPLRRRWAEVQEQARSLAGKAAAARGPAKAKIMEQLSSLLLGFAAEIAKIRVLDPACGSGNFLYVALRRLLDLWKEVSQLAGELGLPRLQPVAGLAPYPSQLYGIEINPYAHQLAQATIWIGYIQWLGENGFGAPPEPVLKPLDNIHLMDAILAYDQDGQPVEPQWPEAEVIIGNPPFLGGSKLRRELSDGYVDNLWTLHEKQVPKTSDLVTYWFFRTWKQISEGSSIRAGLLATQAIRSPINRHILDTITENGSIFLAWSNRPWILDGASVRVAIIGFDDGQEKLKHLDGEIVERINANLTTEVDVTMAKQLRENLNLSFQGSMIGGKFQIQDAIAFEWLKMPNPNGRNNADVLHPYVTGSDVLRNSSREWVIDFGDSLPIETASEYESPFEYIKKYVYPERIKNPRKSRRERWWIHADPQPAMRKAIGNLNRYIATVRVAKHRIFVWMEKSTLCSNKLIVIAREDDYFFGVLHSRLHETWSLLNSSRHGVGNDPAYTPTTTFETFPFPWPPGGEDQSHPLVQAIAQAAQELVAKRDAWLNPPGLSEQELKKRTLTNLYNQRPAWLDLAHKKLDAAVFALYAHVTGEDWPLDLPNEEILARLLALNLQRAANP